MFLAVLARMLNFPIDGILDRGNMVGNIPTSFKIQNILKSVQVSRKRSLSVLATPVFFSGSRCFLVPCLLFEIFF